MIWSIEAAAEIMRTLSTKHGINPDPEIAYEYSKGSLRNLFSYPDKDSTLTAVCRYLIGAAAQAKFPNPDNYYQIFDSGRSIFFAKQLLNILNERQNRRIISLDERVDRLFKAPTFDDFESIIFECAVALEYRRSFPRSKVGFIPEGQDKTPDIVVTGRKNAFYVECKKLQRIRDSSIELHRQIIEKSRNIASLCEAKRYLFCFDIEFILPLNEVSEFDFTDALEESMDRGTAIREFMTVSAKFLPEYSNHTYVLDPSPSLYTNRYAFPGIDVWHGIARVGEYILESGCWLDRINWECVLKWRLCDKMHSQALLLNFRRVEDALKQLGQYPGRNIIHIQFERNPELGHRAMHLRKFLGLESLKLYTMYDNLAWFIFNETEHHVNEDSYFTFSEHGHYIYNSPLSRRQTPPKVLNVFTQGSHLPGVFGVGIPR